MIDTLSQLLGKHTLPNSSRVTTNRLTAASGSDPASQGELSEIKTSDCVLIAYGDQVMRELLKNYLEEHGMSIIAVSSRSALYHCLATAEPCFVILDLTRDRENGLDILTQIRSRSDVPVIVTTGHQLDEAGLVLAFELGADSYMIKPFGLRELLARLKAIFRRQEMGRLMLERAPIHARAALRQALLNAWHESLQE